MTSTPEKIVKFVVLVAMAAGLLAIVCSLSGCTLLKVDPVSTPPLGPTPPLSGPPMLADAEFDRLEAAYIVGVAGLGILGMVVGVRKARKRLARDAAVG